MRPVHLPRRFAILFLILLAAAFLTGNVLVFSGAHAAPPWASAPTATGTPEASETPVPEPGPASADTTGILILGILLVAIILIGLLWGGRTVRK